MQTSARDPDVLTDTDTVPTGPEYAYHETRRRNLGGILREGIRPRDRGPAGSEVDALLQRHGDCTDDTRPDHRSRCAFLYHDPGPGITPSEEVENVVTCIVDLRRVANPIYTADYDLVSDLYGVVPKEEYPRVAGEYWQSCRPFEPGDDGAGELLVEGGLAAEAIIGVYDPHKPETCVR